MFEICFGMLSFGKTWPDGILCWNLPGPRLTKWREKGFSPLPCMLYTWPTSLLCSSVGGREEELRRRRRRHSWSQRPQSPVRGRPAYSCTLTSTHIFLQLWVLLETGQAWVDVEWSQLCGSSSNSSSNSSIIYSSSSSSMGTRWPARGPALNVSPTAFITQPLVFFSSIWIQTTESEIFVNGDKYDSKWDRFFHFFWNFHGVSWEVKKRLNCLPDSEPFNVFLQHLFNPPLVQFFIHKSKKTFLIFDYYCVHKEWHTWVGHLFHISLCLQFMELSSLCAAKPSKANLCHTSWALSLFNRF